MKKRSLLVFLLLLSCWAFAEVRDIDRKRLSEDAAVQKAYDQLSRLEPAVKHWSPQWTVKEVSKKEAVATLKSAMKDLKAAGQASPTLETLLLTGLAAQYAHNVDIEGAPELALSSFKRAHEVAPDDLRPDWFTGTLRCEFGEVAEGMQTLLDVEKNHKQAELPEDFWDDYLTCASVSNSPAHALHAVQVLRERSHALSERQAFLEGANQKRFIEPAPGKEYVKSEVWSVDPTHKNSPAFTAWACGLRFEIPGEWQLDLQSMKDSECTAVTRPSPHKTPAGDLSPSIALVARPAKTGETLQDFAKSFQEHLTFTPVAVPSTNLRDCIAFETSEKGMYDDAGDGYGLQLSCSSKEPPTRGLKFESPHDPPKSEPNKVQYFRPIERFRRPQGTMYYFVLLDTASTMKAEALEDMTKFLKNFEVE